MWQVQGRARCRATPPGKHWEQTGSQEPRRKGRFLGQAVPFPSEIGAAHPGEAISRDGTRAAAPTQDRTGAHPAAAEPSPCPHAQRGHHSSDVTEAAGVANLTPNLKSVLQGGQAAPTAGSRGICPPQRLERTRQLPRLQEPAEAQQPRNSSAGAAQH